MYFILPTFQRSIEPCKGHPEHITVIYFVTKWCYCLCCYCCSSCCSSGDVVVTGRLSYEAASSYNLTVAVSDGLHTSEVKVVVIIVRDQKLEFLLPCYVFDVSEDAGLGSRVGRVSVLDLVNGPVTYGLVSQQVAAAFSVDPVTGILTLNTSLDSEQVRNYKWLCISSIDIQHSLCFCFQFVVLFYVCLFFVKRQFSKVVWSDNVYQTH